MARSKIDVESIGWSEQIKENVSISGSFTVEGQTSIPSSKKVNEKAISLDGVDDRIMVSNQKEFTFGNGTNDLPFSVSAWIYVGDVSVDIGTIVGKFTYTGVGGGNEWMFKQELGKLHFYMYDNSQSGTGDQKRIIANSATVTNNTWHHVVVTCDGGSASPGYTLYTDASTTAGTQVFTNNYTTTRLTGAPLTIGAADLGSGNRIFEDKIADVVIFNKELSSAEVTELYNSGNVMDVRSHSAYDNVISWWKMGDDLDTAGYDGIKDYVSGYHGFLENGASIVAESTLASDNVGPISITRSGSLGVGMETPDSTLHVFGDTKVEGKLSTTHPSFPSFLFFGQEQAITGQTDWQMKTVNGAVVSGWRMPVGGVVTHMSLQFYASTAAASSSLTANAVVSATSQSGSLVVDTSTSGFTGGVLEFEKPITFMSGDTLTIYLTHSGSCTTEDHAGMLRILTPTS